MLNFIYFLLASFLCWHSIRCQITAEIEQVLSNQLDYIAIKHLPSVLHNDELYLTLIYKCAIGSKRRISVDIRIERTLYRTNFAVFRRHWYCHGSNQLRVRYIPIRLHRSLAYASDPESNLRSWPIEEGRLTLTMYRNEKDSIEDALKIVRANVKFLPVEQRPPIRSRPWQPLIASSSMENTCPLEPEMVRLVNYPLVMTGTSNGKHVTFPPYQDYSLRLEQQIRAGRPKFSIIIWLYVDEYCPPNSSAMYCGILQHLSFNNTHYTPELFFTREGQIMVNMFGHLYDQLGTGARTFASVPKKDWCRIAFVVDEYKWDIFVHCLKTWDQPIIATHVSSFFYYFYDHLGTYIIGGSDLNPSFRGLVSQVDFYRRVALRYDQLPKKIDSSMKLIFPFITHPTSECKQAENIFHQSYEQYERFIERLESYRACSARRFLMEKTPLQCSLIRTWREHLNFPMSTDIRYRIFRALLRKQIQSSRDVGKKLFDLAQKLLALNDPQLTCSRLVAWTEQACCYEYPPAYSLLATLHQFGLCNLTKSDTHALDYLFAGAFRNDRLSLLALAHRHFYGLDGVPFDYDAAHLYYRQMADAARIELYNPIPGEAAMDLVRLTDEKLMSELTFDKSDTFYWLKQQALRGVASAQHHLATLMYAGSNGLTRNIQAAVEYFRLGAEQHDPWSHFGYGLALMKGQGTKQNMTAALQHLEKAVEHGYGGARVALGFHAYEIEKNYTKAAGYWQACFDQEYDAHCAHNLGVMWSAGQYPPPMAIDHTRAWQYYSFAAQRKQIDSRIVVAHYNARTGHPVIARNPWLSAWWARDVAEESSALGTIVRRGLEAYRDYRWQTSFIYYLQTATAGAEIGYFNAGYLCHELKITYGATFDCIEDLLVMSLLTRPNELYLDPYAIITVAEYYRWTKKNSSAAVQLYVDLYRHGDPQGLYNLAQMEEFETNYTIPMKIWHQVGILFDHHSNATRYRRLQTIYHHCRNLKTEKSDESYIPCTLAYLRISLLILFEEQSKFLITAGLIVISTLLIFSRRL